MGEYHFGLEVVESLARQLSLLSRRMLLKGFFDPNLIRHKDCCVNFAAEVLLI